MGLIYTKSTTAGNKNCVILDPEEALIYPFGFSDWTKIRVSMMLSYTSSSASNANMDSFGTQSIAASNERQRMFYGVKKLGSNFPAENNEPFVGLKTYGATTEVGFPTSGFDHRNPHALSYIGVHHPNGSVDGFKFDPVINQAFGLVGPVNLMSSTSLYAGLIHMYLEVVNKGQSNQQLIVRYYKEQNTNSSLQSIRNDMISAQLSDGMTIEFNDSGAPYELPDSFFIYNPIPTIRTRVFSVAAIKEE